MDQISEMLWLLYATVSKGLEAVSGCACHGKRSRSTVYHGLKSIQEDHGHLLSILEMMLKEILMKSSLGGMIHLYEDHLPCFSCNSYILDSGTMWFDIHDFCDGLFLKNLVGGSFTYGRHCLAIAPAEKCISLTQCTQCWWFGHCSDVWVCPIKTALCLLCTGLYSKANHHEMASCYKRCPTAKPSILPTPKSKPFPYKIRCLNCGFNHGTDSWVCKYWKFRFDYGWIWNCYNKAKVSLLVLKFSFLSDSVFPSADQRQPQCGTGTDCIQICFFQWVVQTLERKWEYIHTPKI